MNDPTRHPTIQQNLSNKSTQQTQRIRPPYKPSTKLLARCPKLSRYKANNCPLMNCCQMYPKALTSRLRGHSKKKRFIGRERSKLLQLFTRKKSDRSNQPTELGRSLDQSFRKFHLKKAIASRKSALGIKNLQI